MAKFRITYKSGAVEECEQSDCETVEQFANTKFGSVDYAACETKIEMAGEEAEKPAVKPVKKK